MRLSQIIIENDDHINYQGIDQNTVELLSRYKPHFQQWAVSQINEGANVVSVVDAIEYYISKIGDNRLQNLLRRYTPTPKNILSLSLSDIKKSQHDFENTYNRPTRKQLNELSYKIIVDTTELKIIKFEKRDNNDINTAKALASMAQHTRWCVVDYVTGNNYLKQGPIYFIIYKGVKYLCHIESYQLMDVNDDPVQFNTPVCKAIGKYIPGFGIFSRNKNTLFYLESLKYHPESAVLYAIDMNCRWPDAEQYIIRNPKFSVKYAQYVIKHRWPEAENNILTDPYAIIEYARDVINGRWPDAERVLLRNNDIILIVEYAREVINGRWLEAEPIIFKDINYTFRYVHEVVGYQIPEAENSLLRSPYFSHFYARDVINGRWPQAEPIIKLNSEYAYTYARDIIKGRWPEAEPYIMQDPEWAFYYARDVIKGRWPQAEPIILQNTLITMRYTVDVIRHRWPQAEEVILKSMDNWIIYNYAVQVIKGRWLEAEPIIMRDLFYSDEYTKHFIK